MAELSHILVQWGLLASEPANLRWRQAAEQLRARGRGRLAPTCDLLPGVPEKIGQILALTTLELNDASNGLANLDTPWLDGADALAEIARRIAALPDPAPTRPGTSASSRFLRDPASATGPAVAASPDAPRPVLAGPGPGFHGARRSLSGLIAAADLPEALRPYFQWIAPRGVSVSTGQIHRARLHDGTEVAVKVQGRRMAELLDADLRCLRRRGSASRGHGDCPPGNSRANGHAHDAANGPGHALLLQREAAWIRTLRGPAVARALSEWNIAVPAVIEPLSGEGILTTTWMEGERLDQARHWPVHRRNALANTLVRLFLAGLFRWGFVATDPHPRNFRYRATRGGVSLGLADFAGFQTLNSALPAGLSALIGAVRQGGVAGDRLIEHYVGMGFDGMRLAPFRGQLSALTCLLLEPFLVTGPFDTRTWELGRRVSRLLGERRLRFRIASPPGFVHLTRALHGLIAHLNLLGVAVDWTSILDTDVQPRATSTQVATATQAGSDAILAA